MEEQRLMLILMGKHRTWKGKKHPTSIPPHFKDKGTEAYKLKKFTLPHMGHL